MTKQKTHSQIKKGKEHALEKEVQEQWLNTFNLRNLNDSYIRSIVMRLDKH